LRIISSFAGSRLRVQECHAESRSLLRPS
jgi:hypothetical protein